MKGASFISKCLLLFLILLVQSCTSKSIELHHTESECSICKNDLGIVEDKSSWTANSYYSEREEKLTKIFATELGLAVLEGTANKFLAPVEMILNPLETAENIYNTIINIPHLPEIMQKQWEEFSNLPEDQKCAAIARGLGTAISGRYGVSMPTGVVTKNLQLAVGKVVDGERFAKKLNINLQSSVGKNLVDNRSMRVSDFISKYRKSTILGEVPGELLELSVEEALLSKNRTVKKLLLDGRFAK